MIANTMIGNMMGLRTNPKLMEALQNLPNRKMTANEIIEQKASFVYGSINHGTGITKDQVKKRIMERAGMDTESVSGRI